jgi:predicted transcriptional regulator
MEIVWNDNPIGTNEITDRLTGEGERSPKTIQTLIRRLVDKGALSSEKRGRQFYYTPAIDRDDFIDNQRETLYAEFDHAFLGMFPDFVSQLNSMLKEDQRIGKKLQNGHLTNELRIFALIRLGVSESSQIASFLKKSPSTIYNYRVKLRNASIYPHDEFERHVMEIGTPGWHLLENS